MALLEVREKLVRDQSHELRVRFYHDSFSRASLNLWQHRDTGKIDRFQFSFRESVFEMKEGGALRFGRLDEGENLMGVKRSPVMILNDAIDMTALQSAISYLSQQPMTPELREILDVFRRELKT